ncbi:MAG: hypothetical protein J6W31_06005 [Clostridia bacterium]|nr:hypothetical protein [Clostridia bacterium]
MASVYNRQFGPFRGVDFTSNEKDVEDHRMAYAVNLYRNYDAEGGASVETIPGFRRLSAFDDGKINGIHRYKNGGTDFVIVHAGKNLYKFDHECRDDGQYSLVTSEIADEKSTSFQFNNKFYLLDGTHLWSYDGTILTNETDEPNNAYVPLGYLNGEIYEQRNMLTNKMKERYILPATEEAAKDVYNEESKGLILPLHEIAEKVEGIKCKGESVSYAASEASADLSMKYMIEDGKSRYANKRFSVEEVNDITINRSVSFKVTRKGESFICDLYENDVIPDETSAGIHELAIPVAELKLTVDGHITLPSIPYGYCAYDVSNQTYLGVGWKIVCGEDIAYASGIPDYGAVYEGIAIGEMNAMQVDLNKGSYIVQLVCWYVVSSYAPMYSPKILFPNASSLYYSTKLDENGKPYAIELCQGEGFPTKALGSTIDISYTAEAFQFATAKKYTNFKDANPSYSGTSVDAIAKCTLCAVFDGRVFLSGNPDLPNTVFYCQRDNTGHANATYFGVYNFWNEGIEESPIVSLLPTASVLMVFKGDTVQDGSVFYRQGVSLDDDVTPRVYTGSAGVAGIGCVGATCNFFDDPVFLSRRGMEAIGKQTVNLERTMEHRSSNVDAKLMQEDLASAFMVEWKGYLLILCPNGHVYMADCRATFTHGTGVVQYEWFYLEGIGEYKDAAKAYRYASYLPAELEGKGYFVKAGYEGKLLDVPPTITDGIYHDGNNALVEWEGEYLPRKLVGEQYADTTFHGARCALTLDDVLYFGTDNGGLFCFNNDYTGKQAYISTRKDVEALYAAHKAGVEGWALLGLKPEIYNLSRYFYSFAGQPIHSGMITAMSNAGAPMYTKTTEYRTAVCMMRSIPGSRCRIYWRKDMEAFKDAATVDMSSFDFDDMDFSSLVFGLKPSDSISLRVQERRWLNKQYQVYSDEFLRPFGVHSIAYSFHIHGKVRNK